ncbi:hypothetical protein HHI36_012541 [Cryptolaemus montrouzieri]|uniref:HTH psq-type domain-containing protein n=2 Tax=Cryptolaemus montrouzieri TaxID=559131 RepID=A0ABD2NFN3_9CUCU
MPPIKRKTWDHAAMIQAVNAVRRKEIGYLRAAKQFGVPKGTLERYVKKDVRAEDLVQVRMGRRPALPIDLEAELESYCKEMDRRFYGLRLQDIKYMAFQLAIKNNLRHPSVLLKLLLRNDENADLEDTSCVLTSIENQSEPTEILPNSGITNDNPSDEYQGLASSKTASTASVYDNPVPSTSSSVSPFALKPVPRLPKNNSSSKKTRTGAASIITASPYKKSLEESLNKKQEKENKKGQKKQSVKKQQTKKKNPIKKKKAEEVSSSSEDDDMPELADSSGDEYDAECPYCSGNFSQDTRGEKWAKCDSCFKWAHEDCGDILDFCFSEVSNAQCAAKSRQSMPTRSSNGIKRGTREKRANANQLQRILEETGDCQLCKYLTNHVGAFDELFVGGMEEAVFQDEKWLPAPYIRLMAKTPVSQQGTPPVPPVGSDDEEEVPSRGHLKRQAQLVVDAKSRRKNLKMQLPRRI